MSTGPCGINCEETFSAAAIWSLVQWVILALVRGPSPMAMPGPDPA